MRKKRAKKRILLEDPRFSSSLVTRFVNNLMLDGKKNTAFKVFYGALDNVAEKIKEEEIMTVFQKALDNVMPHVEVRSRRIGGATFQIPHPVREDRRIALGIKWMINAARKRIAEGSGVDVSKINKLLKQFKMMSDMMKKMSKGKKIPSGVLPDEILNQLK